MSVTVADKNLKEYEQEHAIWGKRWFHWSFPCRYLKKLFCKDYNKPEAKTETGL